METCSKCHRIRCGTGVRDVPWLTHCWKTDSETCQIAAAAFKRGLREGLAIAKWRVDPDCEMQRAWEDAEAEVERRCV